MISYIIATLLIASYASADTQAIPYPAAGQPASTYGVPSSDNLAVAGPYIQQYGPGPDTYNIQTGFEGYLVPSAAGGHSLVPFKSIEALTAGTGLLKFLKPITKVGLKIIPKIGALLLGVVALFVIGALFTTGICSITPFCTISFLGFGFSRESMRSYLTQDKISSTATFVMDAIKKYRELYDTSSNEITPESEKKSRK